MLFMSTDLCIALSPNVAAERMSVQAAPVERLSVQAAPVSIKKHMSSIRTTWLLARRLNRLGDEGCSAICASLSGNTLLERLSLSSNGAGPQVRLCTACLSQHPSFTPPLLILSACC